MDYSVLARSYNTLDYPEKLRQMLIAFYKDDALLFFSKANLHKKVNDDLLANYHGEEILKFRLANYYRTRDYIAAFEVKALNSRADFLAINGYTRCFEIKSKIDTLSRLKKQSVDYKDIFEYNTIVVDDRHLNHIINIIPIYYGIWTFKGNKRIVHRKALTSPDINPEKQLLILTKKELNKYFLSSNIPEINRSFSSKEINDLFKNALKARYHARWNFILNNWNSILPIDLQFFFNSNIDPELIYA